MLVDGPATRAFIQSFSRAAGSRSTHRSLFVPSLIRAAGTHIRAFLSGAHVLHHWLAAFSPFVIPWRCCVQSFYASVAKALTPSGVVSVQVTVGHLNAHRHTATPPQRRTAHCTPHLCIVLPPCHAGVPHAPLRCAAPAARAHAARSPARLHASSPLAALHQYSRVLYRS